ncbi:MAG TPA: phosphatase PAP2-related protein [Polyangia bacterium]|nr:phosphatase PAP2-related protein [Polyangia bacterium]
MLPARPTFAAVPGSGPLGLPRRFRPLVWGAVAAAFAAAYGFLFTVVHPYVDTRLCVAQLPDPLFALLGFDARWFRVSHDLFYLVTAVALAALVTQALRGDQRPLVRFGLGVSLQAVMRSLTMALLPLCRVTVTPGHAAYAVVPTLDLGFAHIPWLPWAKNDLMFSGHVGEFLILYLAVRTSWPRPALVALVAFQILEAMALVITRGHYTIDIVVAVPFAFLADQVAVAILERISRPRLS